MPSDLLLRLINSKVSKKERVRSQIPQKSKDERPERKKSDHVAYDYDFSSKEVLTFKPAPKIVTKKRVEEFVNMTEFHAYLKLFYSKNPHLVFKKIHQSSLSDSIKQILFYDNRRKVLVSITFREFMESGYRSENVQFPSFEEEILPKEEKSWADEFIEEYVKIHNHKPSEMKNDCLECQNEIMKRLKFLYVKLQIQIPFDQWLTNPNS